MEELEVLRNYHKAIEEISQQIDKVTTRVDKELPCINGQEVRCFDEFKKEGAKRIYPDTADGLCPTCRAYWYLGSAMAELFKATRYPAAFFVNP